jgi:hypothetical protein
MMSDRTYDILANIQRLLAPLATFIVAICGIFGWTQSGEQIAAVISALAVFLGAILKIKSNQYFNTGTIVFPKTEEGDSE